MSGEAALGRRRGRRSATSQGAVVILLAAIGVRGWVAYSGWFSLDDYVFYTRAAHSGLLDPAFLFTSYNGHLMPGAMAWVWLSTAASPLGFGLVATTMVVLQALVGVAFYRLLRHLFGARPAILLPFSVFAFSTLTLPAMVWWAAALNQLPQQLFVILALTSQVLYARNRRTRHGVAVTGWVLLGLAFSEKTALAVPLVALLTALFLVAGGPIERVRATMRQFWITWAGLTVLTATYAVAYVVAVETPVRSGATFAQWLDTASIAARRTVLPGVLGGPWAWEPLGVVDSLAAPPPLAQLLAAAVVGVVVGVSLAAGRRAVRAWAIAALAFLAEVSLIWATRVPVVGVEAVAAEYRYFTDLALVIALAVGLAFMPLAPPLPAERFGEDERWREVLQRHWPRQLLGAPSPPMVGAVGIVLLAVSATLSAAEYRSRWQDNPGRPYFANAERTVSEAGPATVVYDSPVPDRVIWRLLWPATLPSALLPPTGARFVAFAEGSATTALTDLDAGGRLRPSTVSGIPLQLDDPTGCLPITTSTTLRLDSATFRWRWVVQLDYTAETDSRLTLASPTESVLADVPAGTHSLFVSLDGAFDRLLITPGPGGPVCLRSGTVGLPQPVQW